MEEPETTDQLPTSRRAEADRGARRGRLAVVGTAGAVLLLGGVTFAVLSGQAPPPAEPAHVVAPPAPPLPAPPPEKTTAPKERPAARATPAPPASPRPARTAPPAKTTVRPAVSSPEAEVSLGRFTDPSGAVVTFLRGGTLRVKGMKLPPGLSQELFRIYALERVPAPEAAGAPGAGATIRLTSPDPADASVESTTPVFRWTAVPGVQKYTVTLERMANAPAGEWVPVEGASGQILTQAEWIVPVDAPLVRGTRYRWRVEAECEGETLRSATVDFHVLTEGELRRLNEGRDRYGNVPFLLGPLYEGLGFYEEATWEYLKLSRANPASPQAQRALENAKLRVQQRKG